MVRSVARPLATVAALIGLALAHSAVAAPLPDPTTGVWQQVARFGGTAVRGAQVFTVGDAAYVVSGMTDRCIPHHEVWRYTAADNAWTRLRDFPGTPVIEGVGFSIGGLGYVGLGTVNVTPDRVAEFWQYDPVSDAWTRKADFPGAARSGCVAVTIGSKAFVFGGYSSALLDELWEYDQETDAWTQRASCPGGSRFMPFAFSAADRIYVGAGSSATGMRRDLWEYDPGTDTWTQKAELPAAPRVYAIGLALAERGFVAFGLLQYAQPMPLVRDVWQYDPTLDAWTPWPDFAGQARTMATGFVIGPDLYLGLGNNSSTRNVDDVWRLRAGQ